MGEADVSPVRTGLSVQLLAAISEIRAISGRAPLSVIFHTNILLTYSTRSVGQ